MRITTGILDMNPLCLMASFAMKSLEYFLAFIFSVFALCLVKFRTDDLFFISNVKKIGNDINEGGDSKMR